jgi:thioester reductase-like protein
LRHDVIAEPLINNWYAWSYLIPPASAARYLTHAQIEVMQSFVDAPEVHLAALRDPALCGGPFIQYGLDRVPDMRALLERTRRDQHALIALSHAIDALEAQLAAHPAGHSLDTLYVRVPNALRGLVELVVDGRNQPAVRYLEGLLYRSAYYRPDNQSLALRRIADSDQRAFVMSTPRLDADIDVHLARPFADPALDAVFRARHEAADVDALADALALDDAARGRFHALFTDQAPRPLQRFDGPGVRVRYMGHACVLIETARSTVLIDPLVSYEHPDGMARFSYHDLPPHIDYALITHNHQDHVMLETLLQLRHRIGQVVVPAGHRGTLLDPSLRQALERIGFANVREIDRLDEIGLPDGRIVSLPFLGEHGDLDIASKTAWWVEVAGRTVLCAADSDNLDNALYEHIARLFGAPDLLFIGMECEGAPYTWAYGPLLPAAVPHQQAQARRLNGSDAVRGMALIDCLRPAEVCVYAMGQEPWLNYITSIHYTAESLAIVESDKLVAACRARGLPAQRLLGRAQFDLEARTAAAAPAAALPLPEGLDHIELPAAPAAPAVTARVQTRTAAEPAGRDELSALLDALHAAGIQLSSDGSALKVNAPRGALTPELTGRVKAHKPALIALLTGAAQKPAAAISTLPDDARLPGDIRPQDTAPSGRIDHVLLTGATGFVGAFLLRELLRQTDARIHCLVRADSPQQGLARLRDALAGYGLWQDGFAARLSIVTGDLAAPGLGLDATARDRLETTIDVILHNGAQVHHLMPYEQLRAANVGGTVEVLRLACQGRPKAVHFVSSLSVLPPLELAGENRFMEDAPLPPDGVPAGGYNRSKWMAEQCVHEAGRRGLPVTVYRPGPVSGDSVSGAFNRNDFLYRLMQGYIRSGAAPVGEMPLDLLPVDHLARAIVWLMRRPEARGATLHLLHSEPASSDLLFQACEAAGHVLNRLPYDQWYAELQRIARNDPSHPLYPLVALFSSRKTQGSARTARGELPYDTRRAATLLAEAPFSPPRLDRALFSTYLRAMLAADAELQA